MTVALRQQIRQQAFPNVSFGPFRFLEAMPWLVLAASMRVIGFNNLLIAIPAMVFASIAVLHAFLVVTQRSIELAQGQTSLGALTFREQSRLTRAILWRIVVLMIAATMAVSLAGYTGFAPHLMAGLDGMAFDQTTGLGKFWSPLVAALVLLMVVGAEQNRGRVNFWKAIDEFARRSLWLGAAVIALGVLYLGLGLGQGLIRNALWQFYQASPLHPLIKNLIFFVFIFGFATLRLWLTLLVLTWALKQSYLRSSQAADFSSARP